MKRILLISLVLTFILNGCCHQAITDPISVTLSGLLDEMVCQELEPCFPESQYSAKQLTSYDRRSVIPNTPSWHSNDDWSGFIRYEANNGRVEKVLFDETGPGVITRIITTGGDSDATLRIYFDGEKEASITIPAYDISRLPIDIPAGMLYKHEHYPTTQGCSLYYPLPYQNGCKITVDNLNRNYVYHVNYRSYPPGTEVETFTIDKANALKEKAEEISEKLLHPIDFTDNKKTLTQELAPHTVATLELPEGNKAIRTLHFNIDNYKPSDYGQLMRGLIVKISFDGTQTVCAPLSDFSGAGMGAPMVANRYLSADGTGYVAVRFIMPYKKNATVEVENITSYNATATISAYTSDWIWNPHTLYFHTTWRQENGLQTNAGIDYDMATLEGRGILKGDVLSLYNYSPRWYGEGDEHIWVDNETFPSHFGCGTEDYYNTTYAPIHIYHNPFGGAPREDDESSRGYNTFVRARILDAIPFNERLRFEFELISWDGGEVDYSSTVYWYGDLDSKALTPSPPEDALYPLPPPILTEAE